MQAKATLDSFTFHPPVAELPVRDVERAQAHYRDKLGFEVGWLYPGGEIGSVHRDDTAIFFRRRSGAFEPSVHWVYAPDIETIYQALHDSGASIVEPLEQKPWGLPSSPSRTSTAIASTSIATEPSLSRL